MIKRMGVRSGLTQVFNISNKLMLSNSILGENELGLKVSKTVQDWIVADPDFVWDKVHTGQIELCQPAYTLLKKILALHSPEKYKEIIKNNLQRQAKRKALRQMH